MTTEPNSDARQQGEGFEEWLIRRTRGAAERARACPPEQNAYWLGELIAWSSALADALAARIDRARG